MPVTIVSKKTNADVISLTADVVANKAEYDARVVAVDATVADIQADHASHVANFEAEKVLRDAQKADLEAGIADARAEAGSAVADLDAKLDTEKASLQANIDALASSTSGDSGALTSRINELERKTGADLKDTVNSVLTEEVVKTTLDSFLAKDEELTSAVNNAVAERVNMDNDIKAKFDLLVSKLFEGLEISGVTQAELSFGAPVVEFDGIVKEEHIGLWFGNKYQIHGIKAPTDTEPHGIDLKWNTGTSIASMWNIPFDAVTKTYSKPSYGITDAKFEMIEGVLHFNGLPQTS